MMTRKTAKIALLSAATVLSMGQMARAAMEEPTTDTPVVIEETTTEKPAVEGTTTETPAVEDTAKEAVTEDPAKADTTETEPVKEEDVTKPPVATETTTECKDGKIFDAAVKDCVDPKKTELNDDILFKAARELAYAGQYENSLKVLDSVKDQNSARILNYRGYDHRKAGRMELGMSFYKLALQADENYILARSYMGQALIEQGQIEEARVQLIEIRDRGGENTWAYRALLQSLGGVRTY